MKMRNHQKRLDQYPKRSKEFNDRKISTQAKWMDIVEEVKDGRDVRDIAEKHRCSVRLIRLAAFELGVPIQGSVGRPAGTVISSTYQIIADLIRGEMSASDIGRKHGLGKARVMGIKRSCRENGVFKAIEGIRKGYSYIDELEVVRDLVAGKKVAEISDELEVDPDRVQNIADRMVSTGLKREISKAARKKKKS